MDSNNEETHLTESESSYNTSDSGSETEKPRATPDLKAPKAGTDKPNYLWLKTTTEDTEPNEPTRNTLGNQP